MNHRIIKVIASYFAIALIGLLLIGGTNQFNIRDTPSGGQPKNSRPDSSQPTPGAVKSEDESMPNRSARKFPARQAALSGLSSVVPNTSSDQKQLVRFDSPASRANFITTNNLSSQDVQEIPGLNAYQVRADHIVPVAGVEVFSPKRYYATLTPRDAQYSNQWYLPKIDATTTWNTTMGTEDAVVAIIDTGFALSHEDLVDKWAVNAGESGAVADEGSAPNCTSRSLAMDKSCNNLDDDLDGYTDNILGWNFVSGTNNVQAGQTAPSSAAATHGTLTSGLAAADTDNVLGVSGVAWKSRILPIQVLGDDGLGDTVSVALGIRFAVDYGARIINMSLGSSENDPLVSEQVDYALAHNVVVVAAAGNDGCDCISYPGNYPGVIAVGASTSTDTRASFSSYGANLALLAPGTSTICSTAWSVAQPTSLYSCGYSGTSFSSPVTAGAAALLLAQNPNLTPSQVKSALTSTATKVSGMNGQNFTTTYGYGRLNVYDALKSVSLHAPDGGVVNTHSASLAALSGIYRPEMNSICTSPIVDAVCQVRAINTLTNQVIVLSDSLAPTSAMNLYWNANTSGLIAGTWLVQARVVANGQASMVQEDTLTLTP